MISLLSSFVLGMAIGFLGGFLAYNETLRAANTEKEEESELIKRLCKLKEDGGTE